MDLGFISHTSIKHVDASFEKVIGFIPYYTLNDKTEGGYRLHVSLTPEEQMLIKLTEGNEWYEKVEYRFWTEVSKLREIDDYVKNNY